MRQAKIKRKTSETNISLEVNLDGEGKVLSETNIGFFDHMINQLGRFSLIDISINAKGDHHIDDHHTVEDIGICFGLALGEALGDKQGITRYGYAYAPMDEALTRTVIDLSGRGFLSFNVKINSEKVGNFDCELIKEFFQAVAQNLSCSLHCDLIRGSNSHHIIESQFKSFALALRMAIAIDKKRLRNIPSTKGIL